MFDVRNADTRLQDRFVDFAVLSVMFFTSCMLFSVDLESGFFLIMGYSTILLVFVRLCKRVITSFNSSVGEIFQQILGNASGIFIGTCVVLLLGKLYSTSGEITGAVIFSGVMTFFVLGTLSPIVHKNPLVYKSPIVHKKAAPF